MSGGLGGDEEAGDGPRGRRGKKVREEFGQKMGIREEKCRGTEEKTRGGGGEKRLLSSV